MSTPRTFKVVCPSDLQPMSAKWRAKVDTQKVNGYPVDDGQCCVLCGKLAKDAKVFAILADVGMYLTLEEWNRNFDLGAFPVGSDCAKKLTKAGIPTYTLRDLA